MVPPWTPEPPPDEPHVETDPNTDGAEQSDDPSANPKSDEPTNPNQVGPHSGEDILAPPGRFRSTRTALGAFGTSGSSQSMRTGVGRYVRTGLGGSAVASRRFAGTARTAGSLYSSLALAAAGQTEPGSPLDPALLAGRSAEQVLAAVVEAARPAVGTQDAEAARFAIAEALSDTLKRYPDADLLALSEDQRLNAVECYLSLDVFNRFDLDVGKSIRQKCPSVAQELSRMREVKGYIREVVASEFRKARPTSLPMNASRLAAISSKALRDAFQVFEDYLK